MLSSVATSSVAPPPQLPLASDDAPQPAARRRSVGTALGAATGTLSAAVAAAAAKASKAAARPSTAKKPKASAGGYARSTSSARSPSGARKTGPLAFLDDPKLSLEEKLLKLLSYLNDRWNKELDQKMKEFKQTTTSAPAAGGGSSSSSGGLGGFLKKAVSFASSAMPGLGLQLQALESPAVRSALRSVAGPALAAVATAVGQPELAPVALKYGPDVVDAVAGVASSASSGAPAGPAGSSRSTAAKETAGGIGSDRNDQLKLMELQRILDQQKEMFSLVSNMLRTTHETRMAVVQNVR